MNLLFGNIAARKASIPNAETYGAFHELEQGVSAALETFSNVHRGTGHFSMVTTELFEQGRDVFLEYLGLDKKDYVVVFCTVRGADIFERRLKSHDYHIVSSRDIGLPLGLRVLAIRKNILPKGLPFQTGGGAIKDVAPDSVLWADAPDKFEAGTPRIVNVIAFTRALMITRKLGTDCFKQQNRTIYSADEILYNDELLEYSGLPLLTELRKRVFGRNQLVPTAEGEKPYINFDNGACTPTFSPIREAVCKSWQQPENVQADIVTAVKKTLADFLGASPDKYDILFTGNTTEALNIAADLIQNEYGNNSEPVIVNTLLEHNSNELPWRYIPGASLITMPVDSEGFVDLHELEEILRDYNERGVFGKKRVRLVAVSGSSNVLGTINDIAAISKIVHTYHARLLVDAAQLAAHRTINMETCDIDYLAFTGNKVYAPFGCGALLVKKEHIHISNSELKRIKDSGEENIIGITALGKAVILLQRIGMDVIENRERALTARLLQGLSGIKGIEVFGIKDPRSKQFHQKGGVVAFRFKRIPHNLVAKELAELGGIGVRNGCFCAHLLVKHLLKINRARVLLAQAGLLLIPGFTNRVLPGLVRVSFGLQNDEREIERLLAVLKRIESAPRSAINKLLASTGNGTPFLSRTKTGEEMDGFLETCIEKVYSV